MRTFEEHQKGLQTTNSELKEEELRVKLQLAQVERELNSLRVLGHELKCQTTAIYTNITRITSKVTRDAPVATCMCISIPMSIETSPVHVFLQDLKVPEFLGDEEDKGEPEDEKDKPK